MNTTDLDALAISRLASLGQRYTTCRRRIMHILTATSDPMTIPLILASAGFGGLAQSSVYRNLAMLERVGLVQQIPGHHGASLSLIFDSIAARAASACATISPWARASTLRGAVSA